MKQFLAATTLCLLGTALSCSSSTTSQDIEAGDSTTTPPENTKTDDVTAQLMGEEVTGFVVLSANTRRYRSAEEARKAGPKRGRKHPLSHDWASREYLNDFIVYTVVADEGDVVAVEPQFFMEPQFGDTNDDDHCYASTFRSAEKHSVIGYVHKGSLELVISEPLTIEHKDGTQWRFKRGVVVEEHENSWIVHGIGILLSLKQRPPIALSYSSTVPFKIARRFNRFDRRRLDLTFLDPETTIKTGGLSLRAKTLYEMTQRDLPSGLTSRKAGSLLIVQNHQKTGETIELALRENCIELTGRIPSGGLSETDYLEEIGMRAIKGHRYSPKTRVQPLPPPPHPEHIIEKGAPLVWQDGRQAGRINSTFEVVYSEDGYCLRPWQNIVGDEQVCVPAAHLVFDCREPCKASGRCTQGTDGRSCRVGSDEDCRRSRLCELAGHCTARDGKCVATLDADCANSKICHLNGKCTAFENKCTASSTEACNKSYLCKTGKACILHDRRCVVAVNPICERSEMCRENGRCAEDERGVCIADDDGCASSKACRERGRCAAPKVDTSPGNLPSAARFSCIATTEEHCRQSRECKNEGRCTLRSRYCVVGSKNDCVQSTSCHHQGHCALLKRKIDGEYGGSEAYCGAANDKSCKSARWCRSYGFCHRSYGYLPEAPAKARRSSSFSRGWYCRPRE